MELMWKAFSGLVLLLLVQQTATSMAPDVVVESVGDTWITLGIRQPEEDRSPYRPIKYQVAFGTGKRDMDVRHVRYTDRADNSRTTVTLGELEPHTRYLIRVTAVYSGNREGQTHTTLTVNTSPTKYGGEDHTMPHHKEEMMSSGALLTHYSVTYIVIGLHVILTWAMTS